MLFVFHDGNALPWTPIRTPSPIATVRYVQWDFWPQFLSDFENVILNLDSIFYSVSGMAGVFKVAKLHGNFKLESAWLIAWYSIRFEKSWKCCKICKKFTVTFFQCSFNFLIHFCYFWDPCHSLRDERDFGEKCQCECFLFFMHFWIVWRDFMLKILTWF